MRIYCAPMEGLTGYVYRKAHHQLFGGIDKYYMPFVVTHPTGKYKSKELRELSPENNEGVPAVPQILSNDAESFVKCARTLSWLGYDELNLNLGCPSQTVVPKKRGAGLLSVPDQLEEFLEKIFEGTANDNIHISVKTRLGMENDEELERIFEIYERYPFSEVIVHARTRKDMYKGLPRLDAFGRVTEICTHDLCFNGNIYSTDDLQVILERFPKTEAVMTGRGLIADPALARKLKGGKPADKKEMEEYLELIFRGYLEAYPDKGRTAVGRMKENWTYLNHLFSDCRRELKKIQKSKFPEDYREAVGAMLRLPLLDNAENGLCGMF